MKSRWVFVSSMLMHAFIVTTHYCFGSGTRGAMHVTESEEGKSRYKAKAYSAVTCGLKDKATGIVHM